MPRNGFFFLFMTAVAARRDRSGTGAGTGAEAGEAAGKAAAEAAAGAGGAARERRAALPLPPGSSAPPGDGEGLRRDEDEGDGERGNEDSGDVELCNEIQHL